jgi:hypothetical protein
LRMICSVGSYSRASSSGCDRHAGGRRSAPGTREGTAVWFSASVVDSFLNIEMRCPPRGQLHPPADSSRPERGEAGPQDITYRIGAMRKFGGDQAEVSACLTPDLLVHVRERGYHDITGREPHLQKCREAHRCPSLPMRVLRDLQSFVAGEVEARSGAIREGQVVTRAGSRELRQHLEVGPRAVLAPAA